MIEIALSRGWEDAKVGHHHKEDCPYKDTELIEAWNEGVWQYLDSQRWF